MSGYSESVRISYRLQLISVATLPLSHILTQFAVGERVTVVSAAAAYAGVVLFFSVYNAVAYALYRTKKSTDKQ